MDYRITFFKIGYEKELDAKGKLVRSGKDEMLGSVVVDDTCVSNETTLQAYAFRIAPEQCLLADKVSVRKV